MFMNKQESDVLKCLLQEPFINQRVLAEACSHSLGIVNRSIKKLIEEGYLTEEIRPTSKALSEYHSKKPKNAVILAAGFGMRMVPINTLVPKGLLEVNGEPLIERLIKQLHEVGITDITIVVGFLKEQFEYLIDEYEVSLAVNSKYAAKNNLHSLSLVSDRISNTYIVPCDIWCDHNPFNRYEMYSWYMVSDVIDEESEVRVNRKMELVNVSDNSSGNAMVGISYLLEEDALSIREKINAYASDPSHNEDFWEVVLFKHNKMTIPARVVHVSDVVEINTYEQLRELDSESDHLKSDALDVIAAVFDCSLSDIADISVLKKGMTNRSFLFAVNGAKYIMRIPGEGTDHLIDRKHEAAVFAKISGLGLCDDPIYIDPVSGYKITRFLDGVRAADPNNTDDLCRCMLKLKRFHSMKLQVDHDFDIFGQIDFYESLWEGTPSVFRDYAKTKANVISLKRYIEAQPKDRCLTHIDAVPDNFLFYTDLDSTEQLQLTDWEYSGMQDPHVDIAMFIIYSLYDKNQADALIDIYFENKCSDDVRAKIYCYIAACGLLWSNWCEYKRKLGIEFGEYNIRQYRYAKEYYKYALTLIEGGANK